MITTVYCKTTAKGLQSFFVTTNGETYYLFAQNFRQGVKRYFGNGVNITDAIDISKANHDQALIRTMKKLPKYIKYIEKYYGIAILNRTIRKNNEFRNSIA